MTARAPRLLSMVVMGRNDQYMGNFKYRLATCLNYLARQLASLGRSQDVEVLVTDWGSDIPLSQVLPLTAEAAALVRFVEVPPQVARQARPDDFFPSCALNTGLRRGTGEFLMVFDADSLMPRQSVRTLLELLDGTIPADYDIRRAFFFLCRHQIPWEVVQREMTVPQWEDYLRNAAAGLSREGTYPGLGGAGAGQLAHRDIWYAVDGYNEKLIGQGWIDCDFALRVTRSHPYVDLGYLGIGLYHMEHWPHNRRLGKGWVNKIVNDDAVPAREAPSGPDWGLAREPIPEARATPVGDLAAAAPPEPEVVESPAARMATPRVRRHVADAIQTGIPGLPEWEVLCSLAWYSLERYPLRFLEYGVSGLTASTVVAAAAPGVEIYMVDPWQGPGATPPLQTMERLKEVGHRGYARVVAGPAEDAFHRLAGSHAGDLTLDLAHVRGEMLGPEPERPLLEILDHLDPRGLLVLSHPEAPGFARLWEAVGRARPDHGSLVAGSGRVGLVFGPALLRLADTAPARLDFGRPGRPNRVRALLKALRAVYRRLMQG